MIELVFVIVILGIMAAVAVPKFTGIQDDALISSEKTTVGIARQGASMLYGKRLVRGTDFDVTLADKDGAQYTARVVFNSSSYYPVTLDINSSKDGNSIPTAGGTISTDMSDGMTFGLVAEPESIVNQWERNRTRTGTDSVTEHIGPASRSITDTNAEIHQGNYWEYNNTTGKIILK
jgi:type II secretory pathway pseudopilin PulG